MTKNQQKKPIEQVSINTSAEKLKDYLQKEGLVLQPAIMTKSKIKQKIINFVLWILNTRADIVLTKVKK
jgi:hypothetical protein